MSTNVKNRHWSKVCFSICLLFNGPKWSGTIAIGIYFGLSQNVFSRFSKNTFFLDIFFTFWNLVLESCHFILKISDKNLTSSWGSDISQELIFYSCSWKSSWALFNRFYGFILFVHSWIFKIQFEEFDFWSNLEKTLAFLFNLLLIYS